MRKLLDKLLLVSGKQAGRIKKMLIFEALKSFFHGVTIGATMYLIMRVCEQIFEGKTIIGQDVWIVFAIALISIIGKITFGYQADKNKNMAAYSLGAENRLELGDRLKNVNMGYFSSNKVGDISSGLTRVIGELETVGFMIISILFSGTIQTLILGIFIIPFDFITGIIVIATIFIGMAINKKFQYEMDDATTKLLGLKIKLNADMVEYVKGIGVTKAFGKSKLMLEDITKTVDDNKNGFFNVEKKLAPVATLFLLTFRVSTICIILTSLFRYTTGTLTATKAVILIVASFIMFDGLEMVGSMQNILGIANQNIETLLKLKAIPIIKNGAITEIKTPQAEFNAINFAYDNQPLFKNLNLKIPAHKVTAIVGASGSGKTTLCNLLARFWDVDQGKIMIDGNNVKDYHYDDLLSKFTMVFQNVYLFDDTIKNNIKFGHPTATDDEVIAAAKKARCHEFITSLEHGYDTELQEGGSNLSGGERQRISIARAMLKPSKFVILDEATSSVDPENEEKLVAAFKQLLKDKTSVIIAHKLETIMSADQIVVLNQGEIEAVGVHDTLMQSSDTYSKFINYRRRAAAWEIK